MLMLINDDDKSLWSIIIISRLDFELCLAFWVWIIIVVGCHLLFCDSLTVASSKSSGKVCITLKVDSVIWGSDGFFLGLKG